MSATLLTLTARTLRNEYGLGGTKLGKLFSIAPSTISSRIVALEKRLAEFNGNIRDYCKSLSPEELGVKLDYSLPIPGEEAPDDKNEMTVIISQKPLKGVHTESLRIVTVKRIEPISEAVVQAKQTAPKGSLVTAKGSAPTKTVSSDLENLRKTAFPACFSSVPEMRESLKTRVISCLSEQLGIVREEIRMENTIFADLSADSLDQVEIVMALEDQFEIEVDDSKAETFLTVQSIFDYGVEIFELEIVVAEELPSEPKIKTQKASVGTVDPLVEIQALLLPSVLVVVRDGTPKQIEKNHKNFSKIEEILKGLKGKMILKSMLEKVYNLIDMKTGLANWGNGRVEVKNNKLYLDKTIVDGRISDRMVKAMIDGDEAFLNKMAKFLEKLDLNPAFAVVTRLYDFLMARDIEIDEDGDLICWKAVRANYMDTHSGTFDNSPGKEPRVKRNQVDENQDKECSYGLHVCSSNYLKSFHTSGGRVIKVKVSPTDWVAIPKDYNNSKARVCGYKVVEDATAFAKKQGWIN